MLPRGNARHEHKNGSHKLRASWTCGHESIFGAEHGEGMTRGAAALFRFGLVVLLIRKPVPTFRDDARYFFHAKKTTQAMNICIAITIATQAGQPPHAHVNPGRIAPQPPPT